ncbi:hypothetical protein [Aeromonas sp. Y311-2]|jgi:hypothetical protein|uniref:hypothetical protein n=1 Tax=Aeromonas sp. Y311-2 TaxID=2990507 RepID=UPI0022E43380|nr:hypothetical protein [Aeromonas sp. Y311-2]
MESLIILGFFGIMVFAFIRGMKEQLLKNTEDDRRELEKHRKTAMMTEAAKLAAEVIKGELKEQLDNVRFNAAVNAAVESHLREAGVAGTTPRPQGVKPQPPKQHWRAHAAQTARGVTPEPTMQAEQAEQVSQSDQHEQYEQYAQSELDTEQGYTAAAYNRDQDFPQHHPL